MLEGHEIEIISAKKNPAKPKFFQMKETWTHDVCCSAYEEQVRAPSRAEKLDLQQAGLGWKKICFHSKAKFPKLRKKLEEDCIQAFSRWWL